MEESGVAARAADQERRGARPDDGAGGEEGAVEPAEDQPHEGGREEAGEGRLGPDQAIEPARGEDRAVEHDEARGREGGGQHARARRALVAGPAAHHLPRGQERHPEGQGREDPRPRREEAALGAVLDEEQPREGERHRRDDVDPVGPQPRAEPRGPVGSSGPEPSEGPGRTRPRPGPPRRGPTGLCRGSGGRGGGRGTASLATGFGLVAAATPSTGEIAVVSWDGRWKAGLDLVEAIAAPETT